MSKLSDQQKQDIIAAANKYLSEHKDVSQVSFAKLTGIEKTYANQILNGKMAIGTTQIADKYFMAIANYLGVRVKAVAWGHFNTFNFKKIVNKLEDARANTERCGIDGKSGTGKTYAVEMFKKKYPANAYVVKCSATDNAKEFVLAIANEVGVSETGTKGRLVKAICNHLVNMGNDPMLIIDEAENLGHAGVEIVKVLADFLEGRVALAIVGLGIRKILLNGSKKNRQGYMQANRRFSYGWVECSEVTPDDINEVCQSLGITNKSALAWIYKHVSDYDSLRRVCTDAIAEAEKSGCEVNKSLLESLFGETTKYM